MSPQSISDSFESEIAVVILFTHCYIMIDHNTEGNYFNALGIFYKK